MEKKQNRLFVACIAALVATSFGFIIRAILLNDIGLDLNLTESQKGAIQGVGLFSLRFEHHLFQPDH